MGRHIIITDPNNGDFFYKESFKTLSANIQFSGENKKTILFTSVYAGEGKTDTVFHLSAELADADHKVLLIDADMRNSVMPKRLNIDEEVPGLSQYLNGQANLPEDVICSTNYTNLDILLAGTLVANSLELLSKPSFKKLLEDTIDFYDFIFIDSPPLGQIIDAAIIAQCCDGAVLVIESGTVSYRAAQKVKKQIERAGCSIIGVVLNRVTPGESLGYGTKYTKYGRLYKYRSYGYYNQYDRYDEAPQPLQNNRRSSVIEDMVRAARASTSDESVPVTDAAENNTNKED